MGILWALLVSRPFQGISKASQGVPEGIKWYESSEVSPASLNPFIFSVPHHTMNDEAWIILGLTTVEKIQWIIFVIDPGCLSEVFFTYP